MSFVIKFVCVRVSELYEFQRIININFIEITNGTNCLLRFEMFSRLGKQAKRRAKGVGADSTYRMLEAYDTIK